MSLVFSDATGGKGIIQAIERNCSFRRGDITNSSTLFQDFTADVNLALDFVLPIILQASGKWHFDDITNTDYPFIFADLVSGQRDYAFTVDGSGNIIIAIHRVMVASSAGTYSEIYPVDQEETTSRRGNPDDTTAMIDGRNASGTPSRYSKTANGIFLDVIPNYNSTSGLKVFIDREMTYFTTSDTTKRPGFAGPFHEYLALRPSFQYAYRNGLSNTKQLESEMLKMERAIEMHYGKRDWDTPKRMIPNVEDSH